MTMRHHMAALLFALPLLPLAGCGGGSGCPEGYDKNADGRCLPVADGGAGDAGTDGDTEGDGGCDAVMLHRDEDGDGFGLDGETMLQCPGSDGWADRGGDCDDTDAAVNPDAEEQCNGLDDDCDGTPDQGLESSTFYRDADGDGFGTTDETLEVCAAPDGWVEESTDCDDGDAAVHPGATEVCDDLDQNCDGLVDEGLLEPVGEPVVLEDGAHDLLPVAIDDYEGGYIVVWQREDDRLRYELLDSRGTSISGTPQFVDYHADSDPQRLPAVVVVEDLLPPRAVIAWTEGTGIRARAIPLDRSSAPDAVEVLPSGLRAHVVAGRGEAIVVSVTVFEPQVVVARRVDAESGAALDDVASIYGWTNVSLSELPTASFVDTPTDGLLLGVADQRAGDLTPQGYVARVALPSLEASSTFSRLEPPAGEQTIAVTPTPMLGPDGEAQPAALLLSRSGDTSTLQALSLGNEAPPMEEGERVSLEPGGAVQGVDSTARTAAVVYFDRNTSMPNEPTHVHGAQLKSAPASVISQSTWTDAPLRIDGVDIALRSDAQGALVLAVPPTETGTISEIRWQALGCE